MTRRKTPPRQATEPGLAKAALARPHIRIESPVTSLSEDSLVSPASGPGCFPRPSSYSDSVLVLLEHLLSRYTAREISAAQVLYGLQDAVPERRGRRRAELKKRQTGSYGRVCALIVRLLGSFAEGMVKCGGARVEDQTEGKTVQVGTTQAVEEQAARKQEDICVGCAAADVWLDAVQAYLLRAFSGNSEEHSLESQTMESGGPGSPAHRRKKRRRKEGGLERAPRPNVFVVHPPASGDNREGGASPPHETRGGETNDIARQMETLLHAIKQHLHSTREVVEESPVYYQTRSVFIRLVDRVGTSVLSSILSSLSCRMFFTDAYALSIPPAFRRVVRSSVEVLLQILGTCPSNKSEASTLRAMGSAALHNVLLQPLAGSSLASVLSPLIPALHSLMFDLAFDIEGDDVAFYGRSSLCRLTWLFRGSSVSSKSSAASPAPALFSGTRQAAAVSCELLQGVSEGQDPRRYRSVLSFEAVIGQTFSLCQSLQELCCTPETIEAHSSGTPFLRVLPASAGGRELDRETSAAFQRTPGEHPEEGVPGKTIPKGSGGHRSQSLAPRSDAAAPGASFNVASSEDLGRMARALELLGDLIAFGSGQAVPKEGALGISLGNFERLEGGRYVVLDVAAVLDIIQQQVETAVTIFGTRMMTIRSFMDGESTDGREVFCGFREAKDHGREESESETRPGEPAEDSSEEGSDPAVSIKKGGLVWRESGAGFVEQRASGPYLLTPAFEKIFTAALTCAMVLIEVIGDAGVMTDVDGFVRLALTLLQPSPRGLPFLLAARFSRVIISFFERLFTTAPLFVLPLSGPCFKWTACLCDALGHPLFSESSLGRNFMPGFRDPALLMQRRALIACCRAVFCAPFAQLGQPCFFNAPRHINAPDGGGLVRQPDSASAMPGWDTSASEDDGVHLLSLVWRECCGLLTMLIDLQVSRSVGGPQTFARLRGAVDGLALGILLRGLAAPSESINLASPLASAVVTDAESLTATLRLLTFSLANPGTPLNLASFQAAAAALTRVEDLLANNRRGVWLLDPSLSSLTEQGSSRHVAGSADWTVEPGTRTTLAAAVERLKSCLRRRLASVQPFVYDAAGPEAPVNDERHNMGQGRATSFVRVYEEAVRERLIAATLHDSDPAGVGLATEGRPKSAGSLSAVGQLAGIEPERENLGEGTQNAGRKFLLASEAAVKDQAAGRNESEPRHDEDDDSGRQDGGETHGSPDGTSSVITEETGRQRTGSPEHEASRNSLLDMTSPQSISSDEEVGELHDAEEDEMASLLERMREADPAWSDESGALDGEGSSGEGSD